MSDSPTTLDLLGTIRKFSPRTATEAELSDLAEAVEGALRRYSRQFPTEAESRDKMENLLRAAAGFDRALRAAGDIWHHVQRQDKDLQNKAHLPPSHAYLRDLDRIQSALKVLTSSSRKKGRGIDVNRRSLAIELSMMWTYMTGRHPGSSKSSSFLDPRTRFAQFVAAVLNSPAANGARFDALRSNFADFLTLAAKESRTDPSGGETRGESSI